MISLQIFIDTMDRNWKNDYYATENKSYLDSMVLDEDDEKYEKSIMSDTQLKMKITMIKYLMT